MHNKARCTHIATTIRKRAATAKMQETPPHGENAAARGTNRAARKKAPKCPTRLMHKKEARSHRSGRENGVKMHKNETGKTRSKCTIRRQDAHTLQQQSQRETGNATITKRDKKCRKHLHQTRAGRKLHQPTEPKPSAQEMSLQFPITQRPTPFSHNQLSLS